MSHFFLFAGELSADFHGAKLLKSLKEKIPDAFFSGVAGPELRSLGVDGPIHAEDFSVMGYSDVLFSLPRLWSQFRQIRAQILKTQPDVVIFIDSPSFSLRMAKSLRKKGYQGKIVQYICPTVWAYGKERIKVLEKYFDLLLMIYPFEKEWFANSSLKTVYVGNPTKERIEQHQYDVDWKAFFGIKNTNELVAIFPGSRPSEIAKNLPKQLEAAYALRKNQSNVSIAISCAHDKHLSIVNKIIKENGLQSRRDLFLVPIAYSYELMRSCRSAIAKSGTVTLELALHQCPTVVMYEVSALNRYIAKYFLRLKLPHYCIVNILGQKEIFPEFIEKRCCVETLSKNLLAIHQDGATRQKCKLECQQIDTLLSNASASELATHAILKDLLQFGVS